MAKVRAKRHRRAGNDRMLDQDIQSSAVCETLLLSRGEQKRVPETGAGGPGFAVDQMGITERGDSGRRSQEKVLDALELVRIPDVILVGERNDRAMADGHGLLEIPGDAEIPSVANDSNREWGLTSKGLSHGVGTVGRCVITNDYFLWKTALGGDAVKLRGQKAASVKGAQGN